MQLRVYMAWDLGGIVYYNRRHAQHDNYVRALKIDLENYRQVAAPY